MKLKFYRISGMLTYNNKKGRINIQLDVISDKEFKSIKESAFELLYEISLLDKKDLTGMIMIEVETLESITTNAYIIRLHSGRYIAKLLNKTNIIISINDIDNLHVNIKDIDKIKELPKFKELIRTTKVEGDIINGKFEIKGFKV